MIIRNVLWFNEFQVLWRNFVKQIFYISWILNLVLFLSFIAFLHYEIKQNDININLCLLQLRRHWIRTICFYFSILNSEHKSWMQIHSIFKLGAFQFPEKCILKQRHWGMNSIIHLSFFRYFPDFFRILIQPKNVVD